MAAIRRRGTALEDAILDAGWEQLVTEGYAHFTFEAIAERARTGKAALYRRWPDKETLLLAVLSRHHDASGPAAAPDTGSLREDVLAMLRSANDRFGDGTAGLFSTILGAYFDETETTPAQLRTKLLGDRSLSMTAIVRHAVERGEIAGAGLPARVADLPFDLFRHEMMMNLGPVPDATIVDIVDTVFMPLATRG